jgi:hypothetical protein
MSDYENFQDHNDSNKESKLFQYLSYLIALSVFGIKAFLVIKFWQTFQSLDVSTYVNSVIIDDFWRSIINFTNKVSGWIGLVFAVFEIIFQLVTRFKVFNETTSDSNKITFFRLNCFTFPFVMGFFPECIFVINGVDIKTDQNFFIDIYYAKTHMQIFIVAIILGCLGCAVFAICCGKGKYTGTTKVTTTYYSGRRSINYLDNYDPDYEGASVFCSAGIGCGYILVICIMIFFPFVMGLSSYVYTLGYIKEPIYQVLFISEFLLNLLFIYCYSLTYI